LRKDSSKFAFRRQLMTVWGNKFIGKTPLFGLSAAALCVALAAASPAQAAGTAAGTSIQNTATATYDDGSGPKTVPSNRVDLLVDELLDVTVASGDPGDVNTTPGTTGQVLKFTLTNTGNGPENFVLNTVANNGGDDYDPTVNQIVIDTNGNGVYDPGVDTVYVAGSNDPLLNPDQSVVIFVVATTPGSVTDGNRAQVVLDAKAKTGTGTPGASFPGQGVGGGDAVVGASGADANDDGFFRVLSAAVALTKSAVVADPFGGSEPVPGAVITYTITATVTGAGSVSGVTISDPVPANTTYEAGSIILGGTTKTDASDGDEANITANTVTVNVGTVPGGQTRTVTFKTRIN
jgi:uncharacterized repeat protein (TIGR01451 family)